MKQIKNISNKDLERIEHHQEIIIVGTKWVELLKFLSFVAHILALLLTFIAMIGIATTNSLKLQHILEIATIAIVGLIVLEYIAKPYIKRLTVSRYLKDLTGRRIVKTKSNVPLEIDTNNDLASVSKENILKKNEEIEIGWMNLPFESKRLVITLKMEADARRKRFADEDGYFTRFIAPVYIIVDARRGLIKLKSRYNIKTDDQEGERELMITINYRTKEITWSGIFPLFPIYGEWSWDEDVTQEITAPKIKFKETKK